MIPTAALQPPPSSQNVSHPPTPTLPTLMQPSSLNPPNFPPLPLHHNDIPAVVPSIVHSFQARLNASSNIGYEAARQLSMAQARMDNASDQRSGFSTRCRTRSSQVNVSTKNVSTPRVTAMIRQKSRKAGTIPKRWLLCMLPVTVRFFSLLYHLYPFNFIHTL